MSAIILCFLAIMVECVLQTNSMKIFNTIVRVSSESTVLCSKKADLDASLEKYMALPIDQYADTYSKYLNYYLVKNAEHLSVDCKDVFQSDLQLG